jgi:F-type H+-transporting ATPase subunit gamma
MPESPRDVRTRIKAVTNIEKITRAMAMVAAARLRRAVQRIEALRPYASAIRQMTRQAAQASGSMGRVPILQEHAEVRTVGLLLVAGDRGLAPELRPGANTNPPAGGSSTSLPAEEPPRR